MAPPYCGIRNGKSANLSGGRLIPKDKPNRKLTHAKQWKSDYSKTNCNGTIGDYFTSQKANSTFNPYKSPVGASATTTQIFTNILRQLFFSKYNQKYLLTKTHTAFNCSMGQIYGIWKTLKYSLSL